MIGSGVESSSLDGANLAGGQLGILRAARLSQWPMLEQKLTKQLQANRVVLATGDQRSQLANAMQTASTLMALDDFESALEPLQQAQHLIADSGASDHVAHILFQRGFCLLSLERVQPALDLVDTALASQHVHIGHHALFYYLRACAYQIRNQHSMACVSLEHALRLLEGQRLAPAGDALEVKAEVASALAVSLLHLNQPQRVCELLEPMLSAWPAGDAMGQCSLMLPLASAWLLLGRSTQGLHAMREAQVSARHAGLLDEEIRAWQGLTHAYRQLDRMDEALDSMQALLVLDGQRVARKHALRSAAVRAQVEWRQAQDRAQVAALQLEAEKAANAELRKVNAALKKAMAALGVAKGNKPTASTKSAEPLTPREQQILSLLSQGLTNQGIARALGISPLTVRHHVSVVLTKLGASSRASAAAIAIRQHRV